MKYKVGDKVKIKSLDWYYQNKDEYGDVDCGMQNFVDSMKLYCGKILTIKGFGTNNSYSMVGNVFWWTDEMIEGLADARDIPVEHPCDWLKRGLNLPDDYEFQDENGNVINTSEITLVEKKPKYPTSIEECCEVLQIEFNPTWTGVPRRQINYKDELLFSLKQLLIYRDAYWKIADWEPYWKMKSDNYNLIVYEGDVIKDINCGVNHVLSFPTEEMRDAFYENFKDLIESCKELL